jgi:hypothetical protein
MSDRPRATVRRLGALLAPDGPPAHVEVTSLVFALANQHLLLPALWAALRDAGAAVAVPPGVRDQLAARLPPGTELPEIALERAYEENAARNVDLLDQARCLLAALDAADIPATPLKGVDAVFEDLYGDPAVRTMGDIDVLVPVAEADRAAAVLGELGYEPAHSVPPGHHHLVPLARPGRVGVVEVHTGLHDRRARPRSGCPGLRLDRTDAATHLVAHAQLHPATTGRLAMDVRALHQTALMARRVPEVDWEEVRARFVRAGRAQRFDTHVAVAAELFTTPFPLRLGGAGRRSAKLELVLADHPLLAVVDRPGRRLGGLRRGRMERYYGEPLPGVALWRARARYLREVTGERRALAAEARAPSADRA